MLSFCLQSLLREYGWRFVWRVALPHPVKTASAVLRASSPGFPGTLDTTPGETQKHLPRGPQCIVGVGFCLKPIDPPCMSGRSNHDCHYLEQPLHKEEPDMPPCCRTCAIREIGTFALKAGCTFYIMTSAKDILMDVFMPALKGKRFSAGLFTLCRYSLRPFAVGLMVSGIRGRMLPFDKGDCSNYRTWLLADRGIKDEQTSLGSPNQETIRKLLTGLEAAPDHPKRFRREGNVLRPE